MPPWRHRENWRKSYNHRSSAMWIELHTLYGEGQSVKQDCEIHEEPSIPNVVEVILRILMN